MKIIKTPLLLKNKEKILENVKQAKQYLSQGKLSEEELKKLISIDPTPQRKYVGWMAKQLIRKNVQDFDVLRNTIEEFNVFLEKGKSKTRDINQFKEFEDLKKEVDELNNSGAGVSVKELENDYEVIIDNSDLLIVCPHTHEASRKLGLSHFAYRNCGEDSAWCTTYKAPNHFNDYYYNKNVTFYYIKIKSDELKEKLKQAFPNKWESLVVVALALFSLNNKEYVDGYDGLDNQMSKDEIEKFKNIIGIS